MRRKENSLIRKSNIFLMVDNCDLRVNPEELLNHVESIND
jgi:hypothetical protein